MVSLLSDAKVKLQSPSLQLETTLIPHSTKEVVVSKKTTLFPWVAQNKPKIPSYLIAQAKTHLKRKSLIILSHFH